METKVCNKCKVEKHIDKFHKDKRNTVIKIVGKCKKCTSEYQKEWRKRSLEKVRERARNWARINQKRTSKKNKTLRKERIQKKLCTSCGAPDRVGNVTTCFRCWIKRQARSVKISWKTALELLEKHNYLCYYTGDKLEAGVNASIEHLVPKSKDGDNSIGNLKWVDFNINRIKNSLTEKQFINMCRKVVKIHGISD